MTAPKLFYYCDEFSCSIFNWSGQTEIWPQAIREEGENETKMKKNWSRFFSPNEHVRGNFNFIQTANFKVKDYFLCYIKEKKNYEM